jgi:hypothetical protein
MAESEVFVKFEIIIKKGLNTVATVKGVKNVDPSDLTAKEEQELITTVPELLEKVLGFRVHINEVY